MGTVALVRSCLLLPPDSEVAVMRQRPFWDGLMFGFTASLTLWQDLPAVDAAIVLVVLFGFALLVLTPGRAE
jgi:hypothetical protein